MFTLKKVGWAVSVFRRTTCLSARAYHGHFSTTDGQVWKRKLHGLEDFSAAIANIGTGFGHGILAFELKKPVTSSVSLQESVRKAWIRLRFLAPMIALRTEDEPGSQGDAFFFSYRSPNSDDVIAKWADETIKWHPEPKTLAARDCDLKQIWWGTDDHWNMEMHVGHGTSGNLQIALMATHWAIDGHLGLELLDKFFEYLAAELEGKAENVKDLKWGDEIAQLPPAISSVIAPEYCGEVAPPLPQAGSMPNFFRRPTKIDSPTATGTSTQHHSVNHLINLTTAETDAFRAKCRARGFKVTPVLNAIVVLADVEAALKAGIRGGSDTFTEVYQSFMSADGFFIPVNAANRRGAFLPEHTSLSSPLGSPGIAAEAFPTVHDMNAIRKCIRLTDDMQIGRVMSQDAFWDGAVANAELIMQPGKAIPPHFLANQNALTAALAVYAIEVIQAGILCTSVGDFARTGLLDRWRPSRRDTNNTFMTLEEMILSARMTTPTIACVSWQYDGRFTLHLHGAKRFHNEEAWGDFSDAVESRLRHIIES